MATPGATITIVCSVNSDNTNFTTTSTAITGQSLSCSSLQQAGDVIKGWMALQLGIGN